jgi:hypothetical protein
VPLPSQLQKGIVADFSSLSAPSVQSPYSLGLAQIEEIGDAIEELNRHKIETLGAKNWRSVAFTDTFDSQAQYTLASHFSEVYLQPSGEVPLTGLGSQLPFFKRLVDWLGIGVQAEAREEYKSIVAQYTREKLSEPQTENQVELLHSLNDLMLERIARNRFVEPPSILFNPFPFGIAPPPEAAPLLASATEANVTQKPDLAVAASPAEDGDRTISSALSTVTDAVETIKETVLPSEPEASAKLATDLPQVDALVTQEPQPVAKSIIEKVRDTLYCFRID